MASRGGHWTKGGFVKGGGASAAVSAFEDGIYNDSVESAGVFTVDGDGVFSKEGGESMVSFTAAEVAQMAGGILSHNHPLGSSFSLEDIKLASIAGLTEMRAVGISRGDGNRYAYSMKPSAKGWPSAARISAAYSDADTAVFGQLLSQIDSGSISTRKANAIHHHMVWSIVSSQIGIRYSRTRIIED